MLNVKFLNMKKIVLVTGATSGIGEACARVFARGGYDVIVTGRRAERLEALRKELETLGAAVKTLQFDVRDAEAAKNALASLEDRWKQVDVLVNNAGILEKGLRPIDRVLDEDIDRILGTNTKGTMYCMREVSAEMAKVGTGSIVNVASVAGLMGCGGAAYVSSKAAVIGLTRHTAMRFAGTGIRCNAICPDTIVTPMVMGSKADELDPDMMGQMAKHGDLKVQPCMPEDVANILLFFASDESRAITGQAIETDFGAML